MEKPQTVQDSHEDPGDEDLHDLGELFHLLWRLSFLYACTLAKPPLIYTFLVLNNSENTGLCP